MNIIKMVSVSLLLSLIPLNSVWADPGSSGSHGGDPNEVATFIGSDGHLLESWYSVKQDLISGLEMNLHLELDLGVYDPNHFKTNMLNVLRTAKVEWDNKEIIVEGTKRPCENYKDSDGTLRIHCNQTDYAAAMKNYNSDTQYKFEAHEYLALAGYEHNSYGVSDYPIASQISGSLKTVTVKKWAVKTGIATIEDQYIVKSSTDYASQQMITGTPSQQPVFVSVNSSLSISWPQSSNGLEKSKKVLLDQMQKRMNEELASAQAKIQNYMTDNGFDLHDIDVSLNEESLSPYVECRGSTEGFDCQGSLRGYIIFTSHNPSVVLETSYVESALAINSNIGMRRCTKALNKMKNDPAIFYATFYSSETNSYGFYQCTNAKIVLKKK